MSVDHALSSSILHTAKTEAGTAWERGYEQNPIPNLEFGRSLVPRPRPKIGWGLGTRLIWTSHGLLTQLRFRSKQTTDGSFSLRTESSQWQLNGDSWGYNLVCPCTGSDGFKLTTETVLILRKSA